jgi:L-amino acid N-acyltransferase YncA
MLVLPFAAAGGFPCGMLRQWRFRGLMTATIRLAIPDDAAGVQAIYAPVVRDTAISFELEPPTIEDMQQRIIAVTKTMPWLICQHQEEILGYAYASPHRVRAAYQWSVDVSVYIQAHARRSGIGRGLYRSLFALLALQGFYQAYAGITLPNPASVGLHESLGFQPVGVYRAVGYKLGAWHDVGWWQLGLQERVVPPKPLVDLGSVRDSTAWSAALAAGLPLLRI